ncbi:hypothetical protein ACNFIA_16590 [Pseudomonas sp. NY15437]|uniref:hypothetical protein n=1 Tax=Pseudomonas sp. NY15437 TaxID=3400360 RepID=UPI003A8C3ED5
MLSAELKSDYNLAWNTLLQRQAQVGATLRTMPIGSYVEVFGHALVFHRHIGQVVLFQIKARENSLDFENPLYPCDADLGHEDVLEELEMLNAWLAAPVPAHFDPVAIETGITASLINMARDSFLELNQLANPKPSQLVTAFNELAALVAMVGTVLSYYPTARITIGDRTYAVDGDYTLLNLSCNDCGSANSSASHDPATWDTWFNIQTTNVEQLENLVSEHREWLASEAAQTFIASIPDHLRWTVEMA